MASPVQGLPRPIARVPAEVRLSLPAETRTWPVSGEERKAAPLERRTARPSEVRTARPTETRTVAAGPSRRDEPAHVEFPVPR